MNIENLILNQKGIFTLNSLADFYQVDYKILKKEIINLKVCNKLKVYYRLNNSLSYLNYDNEWKLTLGELCKVYITKKNEEVDGSDPDNIEIGFKVIY